MFTSILHGAAYMKVRACAEAEEHRSALLRTKGEIHESDGAIHCNRTCGIGY
jgi:hypothetical protein